LPLYASATNTCKRTRSKCSYFNTIHIIMKITCVNSNCFKIIEGT
jgi:hypothetical protein